MAAVIFPTTFAKPEIIEAYGVPEFFADLAIAEPHGEMVRLLFVTEPSLGASQVNLVARVFMPLGGFIRSKAWERAAEIKAVLNSVQ